MKVTGWILDVYINGKHAVLWVKSEDGEILKLIDHYTPDFYVEPEEKVGLDNLENILLIHPNILQIVRECKFTSLNMEEESSALHIYVDYAKNFRKVLIDLGRLGLVKSYYNVDILHVQRYLFQRGFAPTSRVEAEYNEGGRFLCLRVLDDDLEVEPPPFTVLIFDVHVESEKLTPKVEKDPISKIVVLKENLSIERVLEGSEEEVLSNFSDCVKIENPDFLVSSQASLRYLERAKILGLKIRLGREETNINEVRKLTPYAHRGRVHVNLQTFLEIGVAGIVERSRFTLAPPGLSARWPAGRTIDSRQCYEALRKDILIPENRRFFRPITTVKDTIFRDRGGLILSPKVGLHENVAELDFESMYPHIIIEKNISYETVTPNFVDKNRRGFLGELTKRFLDRRLHFKHLRKSFPKGSEGWFWCEQRQLALKGILVCIYGYSGCFANRFNNVAAYEEINRIARETLVKTMNIAMGEGFEVIYADSDSIFAKKRDARREDYERLAENISDEVKLPIALDHHFKYLVLLAQEADPELEAARRYFGKLTNDELYYRGIELRRHDCPEFLKEFQENLMRILFDADDALKVEEEQLKKAYDYVIKTRDQIMEARVDPKRLAVSKVLRKPVKEYRSRFPHVVAARQIAQKGKRLRGGEVIDFIYVNADHKNPLRRVVPALLLNEISYYDRGKYVETVLDAAETILGTFGFDGKQLGFRPRSKNLFQEINKSKSSLV